MKLTINGEIKVLESTPSPPTLLSIVRRLGYNPQLVVVEFNGLILPRTKWEHQLVKDLDSLEIVTIVGGGS